MRLFMTDAGKEAWFAALARNVRMQITRVEIGTLDIYTLSGYKAAGKSEKQFRELNYAPEWVPDFNALKRNDTTVFSTDTNSIGYWRIRQDAGGITVRIPATAVDMPVGNIKIFAKNTGPYPYLNFTSDSAYRRYEQDYDNAHGGEVLLFVGFAPIAGIHWKNETTIPSYTDFKLAIQADGLFNILNRSQFAFEDTVSTIVVANENSLTDGSSDSYGVAVINKHTATGKPAVAYRMPGINKWLAYPLHESYNALLEYEPNIGDVNIDTGILDFGTLAPPAISTDSLIGTVITAQPRLIAFENLTFIQQDVNSYTLSTPTHTINMQPDTNQQYMSTIRVLGMTFLGVNQQLYFVHNTTRYRLCANGQAYDTPPIIFRHGDTVRLEGSLVGPVASLTGFIYAELNEAQLTNDSDNKFTWLTGAVSIHVTSSVVVKPDNINFGLTGRRFGADTVAITNMFGLSDDYYIVNGENNSWANLGNGMDVTGRTKDPDGGNTALLAVVTNASPAASGYNAEIKRFAHALSISDKYTFSVYVPKNTSWYKFGIGDMGGSGNYWDIRFNSNTGAIVYHGPDNGSAWRPEDLDCRIEDYGYFYRFVYTIDNMGVSDVYFLMAIVDGSSLSAADSHATLGATRTFAWPQLTYGPNALPHVFTTNNVDTKSFYYWEEYTPEQYVTGLGYDLMGIPNTKSMTFRVVPSTGQSAGTGFGYGGGQMSFGKPTSYLKETYESPNGNEVIRRGVTGLFGTAIHLVLNGQCVGLLSSPDKPEGSVTLNVKDNDRIALRMVLIGVPEDSRIRQAELLPAISVAVEGVTAQGIKWLYGIADLAATFGPDYIMPDRFTLPVLPPNQPITQVLSINDFTKATNNYVVNSAIVDNTVSVAAPAMVIGSWLSFMTAPNPSLPIALLNLTVSNLLITGNNTNGVDVIIERYIPNLSYERMYLVDNDTIQEHVSLSNVTSYDICRFSVVTKNTDVRVRCDITITTDMGATTFKVDGEVRSV